MLLNLTHQRQVDREAAAPAHFALQGDVAATRPRIVTRNRQPQPHALRKALAGRAAIKRIKDIRADIRSDTAARILDRDLCQIYVVPCFD